MEEIKKEMGKKEFRELAEDMGHIIEQMEGVLKRHEVAGLSTLTMDTDGYFHFQPTGSGWEFKRINDDSKPMISMTICEEL